jgi:hypothetical protein
MTQQSSVARAAPPALPSTFVDLMAHRKWKFGVSLNDAVDEIHKALWEEEDYQRLLYATYDEHAVEVAKEKLATISKALGVVLRRYGLSRKERKMQVGDTTVLDGADDVSAK